VEGGAPSCSGRGGSMGNSILSVAILKVNICRFHVNILKGMDYTQCIGRSWIGRWSCLVNSY
jgi:hypothetical protein